MRVNATAPAAARLRPIPAAAPIAAAAQSKLSLPRTTIVGGVEIGRVKGVSFFDSPEVGALACGAIAVAVTERVNGNSFFGSPPASPIGATATAATRVASVVRMISERVISVLLLLGR